MGNDGGSIPDRRDLVRSKRKPEAPDRANQTRARWHFCALSKKALRQPVVADRLGKLYRKDAMLEFLLDRGAFGDGEEICGYVRGMKDFKTLTLTPVASANADDDADEDKAKFLCPLTQKEMTGHVPFVYLSTCGCVFSAAGLKAVTSSSSSSTTPSPPAEDKTEAAQKDVCPNCATKFDARTDVRTINPGPEEEERLRAEMLAERAATKGKKRKAAVAGADASADGVKVKKAKATGAATDEVEGGKKRKTAEGEGRKRDGGDGNMGVPRSVAASLAAEEAKRKAGMSDAVKSLYRDKNGPGRKETFMTMGTFTRYA